MENRIVWQHLKKQNTVKPFYNEHAYYKLTLVVKWFSFPVGFKHIVKLRDIMNYSVLNKYSESNKVFYSEINTNQIKLQTIGLWMYLLLF